MPLAYPLLEAFSYALPPGSKRVQHMLLPAFPNVKLQTSSQVYPLLLYYLEWGGNHSQAIMQGTLHVPLFVSHCSYGVHDALMLAGFCWKPTVSSEQLFP
jgi:hypothetical protein